MDNQALSLVIGAEAACCVLAVAAVLYARLRELYRRKVALKCIRSDVDAYLASADIVLCDTRTPYEIRRMVLLALKALSSEALAEDFMGFIAERQSGEVEIDVRDRSIDLAFRRFQAAQPDLAVHAQEAAFGLLFCVPIMYADRLRVDFVREGAVRPDHLWARFGSLLSRVWPPEPTVSGPLFTSHLEANL